MARHATGPEHPLGHGGENGEKSRRVAPRAAGGSQNGQTSSSAIYNPFYTGRPRTPGNGPKSPSIDRQEIIRRIKGRESRPTSPELDRPRSRSSYKNGRSPTPEPSTTSDLPTKQASTVTTASTEEVGLQIERPRSALHRGDFREKDSSVDGFENFSEYVDSASTATLSTSPVAPWHPSFPRAARQPWPSRTTPSTPPGLPGIRQTRSRAVSTVSLASTFVYKPPTSPLVQASRPDTPDPDHEQRSRSPDKSRRHTFSPQSFQRFQLGQDYTAATRSNARHLPPSLRSENTYPYQAHQPRRSVNSFASLPESPVLGARRPSLSDSPLHLAPMVGSYEESILRGRMSTTPSKPLNFVAQIGVLGKGECKANLRCPPHVTVPFPAVFYSYNAGARETTGGQPSPYVGHVDLENGLPAAANMLKEKRRQRRQATVSHESSRANSRNREESSTSDIQAQSRQRQRQKQKQKRRSGSPKAPPGGSYRIPQQGQIQVIIKNPNKTAVKLFLIPYDLSDMEPGQKTFIRQRSYSAGPIIDMPLSSRKNWGTDIPEAALNTSDDPNDRPVLRYLVHLHICCPSKGRFFLYKSIRVVFANRVPDGKEKLRNEIQLPDPRYSTYKPGRDSHIGLNTPRDGNRRRSMQDPGVAGPAVDLTWQRQKRFLAQSLPLTEFNPDFSLPMQPVPHHVTALPTLESRPASRQMSDNMDIDSERSHETYAMLSPFTSPSRNGDASTTTPIRALDEPIQFDRDISRERCPGTRNESLLSRRLKDLAFQSQQQHHGYDKARRSEDT